MLGYGRCCAIVVALRACRSVYVRNQEAPIYQTKIFLEWSYFFRSADAPPSGKCPISTLVRHVAHRDNVALPKSMRFAAMVGFVIENLASCKIKVPFLRDHVGEITILKIATAKDVTKKPKIKKFPTEGVGGASSRPFIAIAQVTANKFIVHPGSLPAKIKRVQYPTALLQTMDASGVFTTTEVEQPVVKKRRGKAKPENEHKDIQQPKDIVLPDDLAEINATTGGHRGLKDVVALGTFLGEKASAENRRLDLAKACSQLDDNPLTWDLGAERTKCFVVYKVGEVHFCVASYIKLLVQYCAGVDSSQDTGQSQ